MESSQITNHVIDSICLESASNEISLILSNLLDSEILNTDDLKLCGINNINNIPFDSLLPLKQTIFERLSTEFNKNKIIRYEFLKILKNSSTYVERMSKQSKNLKEKQNCAQWIDKLNSLINDISQKDIFKFMKVNMQIAEDYYNQIMNSFNPNK